MSNHGADVWEVRRYTNKGDDIPDSNFMVVVLPPAGHRFSDKEFLVCDSLTEDDAHLISAAPDMFAAIDAADTAFAVLNVQDLGGQARQCIREAWPLVQSARAKALPDSGYADAVKEAQQHEIARLDKLVAELQEALECALDYIDEIPSEVAASFPSMPGFDRDWANSLLQKYGACNE